MSGFTHFHMSSLQRKIVETRIATIQQSEA